MTENCSNCRFFAPLAKPGNGVCRRHAPALGEVHGEAIWPRTRADAWCGSHKLARVLPAPSIPAEPETDAA